MEAMGSMHQRTCRAAGAVVALAAALVPASPGRAQQPTAATIYRDAGFTGPAVAVSRANPNMRLTFSIQSIRIDAGTWELCPQANFRGKCITVSQPTANLARDYGWRGSLQSIRPLEGTSPGGRSPTLKGMAAQFFPQPRDGAAGTAGNRVAACAADNGVRADSAAACARTSADRFCAGQGWTRSSHELIETIEGRNYLADVLCVRRG